MGKGKKNTAAAMAMTVRIDLLDTVDVQSDGYDSESSCVESPTRRRIAKEQRQRKDKQQQASRKKSNKNKQHKYRETEETKIDRSSESSTSSAEGAAAAAAIARSKFKSGKLAASKKNKKNCGVADKNGKGGQPCASDDPSGGDFPGARRSPASSRPQLRRPSSALTLFRRSSLSRRGSFSDHAKAVPMRVEGAQRNSLTPKAARCLGLDEDGNVVKSGAPRRFSISRTLSEFTLRR